MEGSGTTEAAGEAARRGLVFGIGEAEKKGGELLWLSAGEDIGVEG